jgi:PAS domain S-box-containing protein
MKFSFEKNILIGFIINLLVVVASGWVFIARFNQERDQAMDTTLDWIALSLFVLSFVLLTIVYFIIRTQFRAKNISQNLLFENKELLQSIIDNTSNPIFIKKINGEYLLVNKEFESLFHILNEDIVGKTDFDFLPKNIADGYRYSDFEVARVQKELKSEEIILQSDGPHTYIAVKFPLYDSSGRIYAIGGISTDISERKKREESLKVVNNFFEMSFDPFFVAKGKKIIKINPAFTKISGYVQSDLEKLSVLDLIHPDYVEAASERLAKRLEGEKVESNVVYPVLCKDGSYKWVESMIATDVGTEMIYVVLEDITEKRINEEKLANYNQKLKEDEEQIQAIFNGAPDPVIVIDSDSLILKWNPKAKLVFGWDISEVIGKPLYEIIVPVRYREAHKKGMEHFMLTGIGPIINKTYEIEAVNKEGIEFPVSLSVSPVKLGEKYLFIGFVRDITENKKAINALSQNEEKLQLILENIGDGVIVANADKKIILANYMANEIFGIHEDDQISPNLVNHFELYFPDGKTVFPSQNLPMERALEGEVTDDVDVVLWDPITKEKRRVLISGRPLIDQDNAVVAAVVTIKDISKYKQMEEELKETESKYRQLIGFRKGGPKEA